jgi:hypothetical protein
LHCSRKFGGKRISCKETANFPWNPWRTGEELMAARQKQSTNEKKISKHQLAEQKLFHLFFATD